MDLYLIRHGQSGSAPNRINEKALSAAGIVEVERTGEALRTLNIVPDVIVTSPIGLARHSAEIVDRILFANKRGTDGKPKKKKNSIKSIRVWNDLAPEGDRALVYENLAKLKYDTKILIVGHEPFLTRMAADIVSSSSPPSASRRLRRYTSNSAPNLVYNHGKHRSIVLKRSGLAKISITSVDPKLEGELRWLLTPMLLKRISSIKMREKKREKKNQKITQYPSIASSSKFNTSSKTKSAVTAIYQ